MFMFDVYVYTCFKQLFIQHKYEITTAISRRYKYIFVYFYTNRYTNSCLKHKQVEIFINSCLYIRICFGEIKR